MAGRLTKKTIDQFVILPDIEEEKMKEYLRQWIFSKGGRDKGDVSDDVIGRALQLTAGNYAAAGRLVGLVRASILYRVNNNPDLKKIALDAREEMCDLAETNINKAVRDGDIQTSRWFLDRQGKERGYTTRQENTGRDGEPLPPPETNVTNNVTANLNEEQMKKVFEDVQAKFIDRK